MNRIVKQTNGYNIFIAKGMDMNTVVKFACVIEFKDGFKTRETPRTTCVCKGICYSGCDLNT